MSRILATLAALTLVVACKKPDPHPTDDTGSGGEEGAGPYDCGQLSPAPELSATDWSQVGQQPPAAGIVTMVQDFDGGVLYAGSHSAGMWSSQDEGDTWDRVHVQITHTLADLYVPPGRAGEVFRSSGGRLEKTVDYGGTWRLLDAGSFEPDKEAQLVLAIAGAAYDGELIYLVTSEGSAWRSEDAGESWEIVGELGLATDPEEMLHLRHFNWRVVGDAEPGDALVFAWNQGVWVSWDQGATWESTLDGVMAAPSLVRDPLDSDHLVVAASGGELFSSHDGGATWEREELGVDITAAHFSADGATLALVGEDTLLLSSDSGESFTTHEASLESPGSVTATTSGRVLVADDDGMAATDDGGGSWARTQEGLEDLGMAVLVPHPVCPDRVFAGSRCSGGLFHSTDWGQSWTHIDQPFHYVMAVHHDPSDPDTVYVVSDDAVYVSRDGGSAWQVLTLRYHYHGFAVHPEDGEVMLLGSVGSGEYADSSGRVYRSEDGGRSWTDSSSGLPSNDASAHTIAYWPGDPEVVILGTYKGGDVSHQDGEGIGLWRSEDGGSSWSQTSVEVTDVAWITDSPRGLVAATSDGLWESTDKGLTWAALSGPAGWLLSVDFAEDRGLAVSHEGEVWQSVDGGLSWSEMSHTIPWDPTTWLAQVAIASDGSQAWLSVFNQGVWQLGLE